MNSVDAGIDAAVKKGSETFTKKATSNLLGKDWGLEKLNWDKVFKEGKGLAIKDAAKTSSTMFLPTDFQEESKKFAQIDYQNNPQYYQDMWNRGETGVVGGSPIEQLITNWNADVGKFIYGDRDYLKSERESYLGNQQSVSSIDDFKAAIDDATKSIQQIDTSNWQYMGKVQQPTTSIDTSGWSWGYNNSEIERQIEAARLQAEQAANATLLPNGMPNMDSGWWTQGRTGNTSYFEDPNGNKYGFGMNEGGNYSMPEVTMENTWKSALTEQQQMITNEITALSQVTKQQQPVQTSAPQTIQISINVQGSDKNEIANEVVSQIERDLPSIIRQNQPRIVH
jgi:hypothetical protein